MKAIPWSAFGVILAALAGCDATSPTTSPPPKVSGLQSAGLSSAAPRPPDQHSASLSTLEVAGRTQRVPGKTGLIAPVPLHPVTEVLVQPGDRVKKGQTLVKLDDDEPQADVRARQAALESARISLKAAQRNLAVYTKANAAGVLPEQRLRDAGVVALKAEQDERAAQAALESAQAELEHYTVAAPIDGVVVRLDVHPGTVSRPGTTVWGEVLDLSEIDVRCELTPEQADGVALGQSAAVLVNSRKDTYEISKVVYVGIEADKSSGLVPVVLRLDNTRAGLRCNVPVTVRFRDASSDGK
jgi:RND family efflux transporter MFP subunit